MSNMQKTKLDTTKWDLLKGLSLSISTESVDSRDIEDARRSVDSSKKQPKQAPKQKQQDGDNDNMDGDGFKVVKLSLTCHLQNKKKRRGIKSAVAFVCKTVLLAALMVMVVVGHVHFHQKTVAIGIFSMYRQQAGATAAAPPAPEKETPMRLNQIVPMNDTVKLAMAETATAVDSGPTYDEADSHENDTVASNETASVEKEGVESTVTTSNDTNTTTPATFDLAEEATVAICAIMKDEELYLEEWLLYYLALGIDRIYIYNDSDNSTKLQDFIKSLVRTADTKDVDPSRKTTAALLPEDFVVIHNLKGGRSRRRQIQAYKDCMSRYVRPNNHTWAGFLDPDEFLVLKKHKTLKNFLSETAPQGSVSVNWVNFGTSNETSYRPHPVTQRFQYHMGTHWTVKTFVKSEDYKDRKSPHWVLLRDDKMRRDPDGVWIRGTKKLPNSNLTNSVFNPAFHIGGRSDVAALFHYRTKSLGEYKTKFCERGDVFDANKCTNSTFLNVEPGYIHDDSAWKFLQEHYPGKYGVI